MIKISTVNRTVTLKTAEFLFDIYFVYIRETHFKVSIKSWKRGNVTSKMSFSLNKG